MSSGEAVGDRFCKVTQVSVFVDVKLEYIDSAHLGGGFYLLFSKSVPITFF